MHENIPTELQVLPQWVVAGPDKRPLNPKTGAAASVTDSSTWGTFEEAIATGLPHVGFVLTEADPYCIIDLDDKAENPCTEEQRQRHALILDAFESYVELSASGRGYHIIVKGRVSKGVRRDNVEVYSSARYMICTGNVVKDLPIKDEQRLLDDLYGEMSQGPSEPIPLVDHEEVSDDHELVERAMRADNAEKFNALCAGDWQAMGYPSQSEADFALLSMLAFYSRNNEQVRRLFRMSGLGKRPKAHDDRYLDRCLKKIRVEEPVITTGAFQLPEIVNRGSTDEHGGSDEGQKERGRDPRPLPLPHGLVGQIAEYIHSTSYMPVPEVAIAAALALVAGIAGRQYNVTKQGLNLYLMLLAETGAGKEGAATGIDQLLAAVRPTVPAIDSFKGPAAFASGPALVRSLSQKPCMLSVQGEFGFTLKRLANPRFEPDQMLKQALMDVYTKSAQGSILHPTNYSDSSKNTDIVASPSLTLLGESTQLRFFAGLDSESLEDGLIPRLLVIEYDGDIPYPRDEDDTPPPSSDLIKKLIQLATAVFAMQANNKVFDVPVEPNVKKALRERERLNTDRRNANRADVEAILRSRSALMIKRVSALLAVGVDINQPVVTMREYEWAVCLIERSIRSLSSRFDSGDYGVSGDGKLLADLRHVIDTFLSKKHEEVSKVISKKMHIAGVLPYRQLLRSTSSRAAFRNDIQGATNALKRTIQSMIDSGELVEVSKAEMLNKFGVNARGRFFVRANDCGES